MATVEQVRLVVDAVAAAVRKTPTSRRSKSRAMTRDSGSAFGPARLAVWSVAGERLRRRFETLSPRASTGPSSSASERWSLRAIHPVAQQALFAKPAVLYRPPPRPRPTSSPPTAG